MSGSFFQRWESSFFRDESPDRLTCSPGAFLSDLEAGRDLLLSELRIAGVGPNQHSSLYRPLQRNQAASGHVWICADTGRPSSREQIAPPGGLPTQGKVGKGRETPTESTWENSTTNTFFLLTCLKQYTPPFSSIPNSHKERAHFETMFGLRL
jgi:hypothetical protein